MNKLLQFTEQHLSLINTLLDHALKGGGIAAYNLAKQVEAWIQSGSDVVTTVTPPAAVAVPAVEVEQVK